MNEHIWWYLSRSTGIVALVLLVASLVWGVLLATRVLRPHDRPAWLLDLHRWLGGSAVVMTLLHLLGLWLDGYIDFDLAELFVPGASPYEPFAIAVGIVSFYVLVVVELTSLMKRRLSPAVWRSVHVLSYGLVWGATLHAGLVGTDTTNRVYQGLAIALTAFAVAATITRLLVPSRRGREPATTD